MGTTLKMTAVQPSILRVSDLDPFLAGNATFAAMTDNLVFMEKLVFGLILADVVLFAGLCLAICAICRPCDRSWAGYGRDEPGDINEPRKPASADPA